MTEKEYHEAIKKLKVERTYEEALQLAHNALIQYKDNDMLKNDYGWCLYYIYLKNEPINNHEIINFKKALKYIIKNIQPQNIYSPLKLALMKAIEYSKKVIEDKETLLSYYEMLGRENLSIEEKQIEREGKMVTLPTEKEKWYMNYSKALFEAERYENTLELCDRGLQDDLKFHNQNREWLIRRKGDCLVALGDIDQGINLIQSVRKYIDNWAVDASLAKAYGQKNDMREMYKYLARAAQSGGIDKTKVKLYRLYAEYLKENNPQMAYAHLQLVRNIYQQEGWNIKANLINDMQHFINIGTIEEENGKVLERKLKNFWADEMFTGENVLEGRIKSILSNGKAGFIEATDGKQYYFQFKDFRGAKQLIKEGMEVTFYIEISFDKAKQRESLRAIGIKFVERGD